MSIYQFLASDSPLQAMDNSQIELLSIEEAEIRGLSLPNWYSVDMNINRKEKIVLFAPNEECLHDIRISNDNDSIYAKQYSNKCYYSSMQWVFSDKRAEQLLDYIKAHLITASDIELWNIWLDEYDTPTIKRCPVDDLTVSVVRVFWGQNPYEKPNCLIIHR